MATRAGGPREARREGGTGQGHARNGGESSQVFKPPDASAGQTPMFVLSHFTSPTYKFRISNIAPSLLTTSSSSPHTAPSSSNTPQGRPRSPTSTFRPPLATHPSRLAVVQPVSQCHLCAGPARPPLPVHRPTAPTSLPAPARRAQGLVALAGRLAQKPQLGVSSPTSTGGASRSRNARYAVSLPTNPSAQQHPTTLMRSWTKKSVRHHPYQACWTFPPPSAQHPSGSTCQAVV